tara:strand:+ start:17889 stop:17996 length:108 start_codon:yes stop_codon:yes gene_type:complete
MVAHMIKNVKMYRNKLLVLVKNTKIAAVLKAIKFE